LGLGRSHDIHQGIEREWLYWYDDRGNRFLEPEEKLNQVEQQLAQERPRSQRLADKLRELNIDPDLL
jgi:hypothetical protein